MWMGPEVDGSEAHMEKYAPAHCQGGHLVAPIIGIASDCVEDQQSRLNTYIVFDAYVSFVAVHAQCTPLIIPCLGTSLKHSGLSALEIIHAIDGLLLPGSRSNVHPSRYGAVAIDGVVNFDEMRDATTLPLIRAAVESGIPVLGICRGAQELNCAFGGSLHQAVHTLSHCLDHRAPRDVPQHLKYGAAHALVPSEGSWLEAEISVAKFRTEDLQVNSLHAQAIDALGAGLIVDARAPDGIVEAISMPSAPAPTIGVQWHPEWHVRESRINALILKVFLAAVRRHYAERAPLSGG
jgi:putative glutamine amidotransferase